MSGEEVKQSPKKAWILELQEWLDDDYHVIGVTFSDTKAKEWNDREEPEELGMSWYRAREVPIIE